MLVAPVFGVLLYIFVEFQVGVRWLNARLEHMHETTKKHWTQDETVQEQLKEEDSESHRWHIMSVNTADFRHMKTPASNTSAVGKIRLKN